MTREPRVVGRKGKKYREYQFQTNSPIEIENPHEQDIHVDELKKYIEKLIRKSGNRGFGLDEESAKSLFDYLSVLNSVAKIEEDIKKVIRMYNQLRQNDDIQFPKEINRKICLLRKVRKEMLKIDIDAQKENRRNRI